MSKPWKRNNSSERISSSSSDLDIPRRAGLPLPTSPQLTHHKRHDGLNPNSPSSNPRIVMETKEGSLRTSRKTWERRLGSFLRKQNDDDDEVNYSASPSDVAGSPLVMKASKNTTQYEGGGSGDSACVNRVLQMRSQPPPPTHESRRPAPLPPSVPVLSSAGKAHKQSRSKSGGERVGFSEASSGDASVRGGKMFSSFFPKKRPNSVRTGEERVDSSNRRTRSVDTLDETRRKGSEKAFSPTNERYQQVIHTRHSSSSAPLSTKPPLPSAGDKVVAEESTDPSTTTIGPAHPQPEKRTAPKSDDHDLGSKKVLGTDIKKVFTKYHNSVTTSGDSTSAYLGDDPSSNTEHFTRVNNIVLSLKDSPASRSTHRLSERGGSEPRRMDLVQISRHHSSSALSRSVPSVLETVREDGRHPSFRVLRPIHGPDEWKPGRRYLIAPAALVSCSLQTYSLLSGGAPRFERSGHLQTLDFTDGEFGCVLLGRATMTYVGNMRDQLPSGWSTCFLALRQNYLLEYEDEVPGILPRGFAHLEGAKAGPHPDYPNTLILDFYGRPCSRTDRRELLVRTSSAEQRDRWINSLNHAARIQLSDLYDYDEENPCGRGRYATVYPARRRGYESLADSPFDCAIKVIEKAQFWQRVVKGVERADTLVREAAVQATLSAQSGKKPFLKLKSFFETSDQVVFEIELLEGTDLFHYISEQGALEEVEAANIARDMLTSLDAMKRLRLAHRDVKPANILMCDKEKDGVHVKLADFGMSTFVGVDGLVHGRCGTPGYVAPEIFSAGAHGGYGNKVDIFSAGVTLYVMLCGYEPFFGKSDAELIEANREADVDFPFEDWDDISDEARDLVEKMLRRDPGDRIDASEALQHPWIKLHSDEDSSMPTSSLLDQSLSSAPSDSDFAYKASACTVS